VATTFLYLTVQKRITVDIPLYLKYVLKVTHPSDDADFYRFCLMLRKP